MSEIIAIIFAIVFICIISQTVRLASTKTNVTTTSDAPQKVIFLSYQNNVSIVRIPCQLETIARGSEHRLVPTQIPSDIDLALFVANQ